MAASIDGVQQQRWTTAIAVVQYAYPIALLTLFLAASTLRSIFTADPSKTLGPTPSEPQPSHTGPGGKPLPKKLPPKDHTKSRELDFSKPRKLLFSWLTVFLVLSYIASAANVILHALVDREHGWWSGKPSVIYIVGSFFVYCVILISLLDSQPSPSVVHLSSWLLGLALEIVLFAGAIVVYNGPHREPTTTPPGGKYRKRMTDWEAAEVLTDAARILLLCMLVGFYALFVLLRNAKLRQVKLEAARAEETTGLLSQQENGAAANGRPNGYGSVPNGGTSTARPKTPAAPPGWERPATVPSRSWWEYVKSYGAFFPYLWPSKDKGLQVILIICFVIVFLQRGVQLLVPIQLGVVTDYLSGEYGEVTMPWGQICLFILYRLLQGSNGILGAIRGYLWIPVSQYSYRELSVAAFEHVHGLSLEFHLGKKTGEVLSALGKGSAINNFLEQLTFNMIPMVVDLLVAIVYFMIKFDAYYALIIAIVTFWYIYLTIRMAQWRSEIRRVMVNSDREVDAVKNDSMVSYETVKYFNAEEYEFQKFRKSVEKYQAAEAKVLASLNYMNVAQNACFMLGLLATSFLTAYQVTRGERKVGAFVTMITYMAQLQSPLNFFGTFYRMIQGSMINAERLLELFKEQPTVIDEPEARAISSSEGQIRFDDVYFAYDERKPALNNLSFECKPGSTTALVGESGGGKSTVFRLLFRYYNAQSGSIQLDGHDVKDITIDSLRRQIGVVPQDTVLFNDSLIYNLRYANQSATDEEIYDACRAASIHDKILTFPDGYKTIVGERGLRLSGGEKQRIAIARTILKGPRIIMLDEATAALDTETEQHIQDAFRQLGQGRTVLVIAHRLSTITHADQILVLQQGKVVERGSHSELLTLDGHYAKMWTKQVQAQRAAEEAQVYKDRADKLRREVEGKTDSASQSEDEDTARIRQYQRTRSSVSGAPPDVGAHGAHGHHAPHGHGHGSGHGNGSAGHGHGQPHGHGGQSHGHS